MNEASSTECDCGRRFMWHGPDAGVDRDHGVYSGIKVMVGERGVPEDLTAQGYDLAVVRGAEQAYMATQIETTYDIDDQEFEILSMGLEAWSSGRHVHVDAHFPVGPVGEQMMRDLVASLDIG